MSVSSLGTRLAANVAFSSSGGGGQDRGAALRAAAFPAACSPAVRPSWKGPQLAPRQALLAQLGMRVGGGPERHPKAQQLQVLPKPAPLGTAPPLLSPREEKFLGAGSSLALSRRRTRLLASGRGLRVLPWWPRLWLGMVPPAPASGPLAQSPPAQRGRLASCTPPPPRAANQRRVPRPGPRPRPRPAWVSGQRQSGATRARVRGAGAAERCPEASAVLTVTGRPPGTDPGG